MPDISEIRARHQRRLADRASGLTASTASAELNEAIADTQELLDLIDNLRDSRVNEYVLERAQDDLLRIIKPEGIAIWWETSVPALGGRTPRKAWNDGDIAEVARVAWSYLDPSFT